MRIPLVVSLAPLAFALACTDEGPIQSVGPKLTISPATVSVETGADPITLQAVPQNGDLTGNVTWDLLSGNAGALGASNGQTVTFTPTDLGTPGGDVLIKATATVGGTVQPATAGVQVVPSTHGRIVLGIDPGGAVGSVDVTDPASGSTTTFVANAPTVLSSKIIDAGTYTVTADAGIVVPGTLVDGVWDGAVQFDGGTPARSVQVPVRPNAETGVGVTFALRGFLGRAWLPVSGGIHRLHGDRPPGRPRQRDADRRLCWRSAGGGFRRRREPLGDFLRTTQSAMYTPDVLNGASPQAAKTVSVSNPTGIAIRGNIIAVGSCSLASTGAVSTFARHTSRAAATTAIPVGCVWGISFDAGDNGKLWVMSRSGQSKVYRFTAATSGTVDPAFTTASITDAYGIAVDASGNAWVSSCSGNSVQQISPPARRSARPSPSRLPVPGRARSRQAGRPLGPLSAGNGGQREPGPVSGGTPERPAQLADPGHVRRDRLRPRRGRPPHAPVDSRKDRARSPGLPCRRDDRVLAVRRGEAHLVCTMPDRLAEANAQR